MTATPFHTRKLQHVGDVRIGSNHLPRSQPLRSCDAAYRISPTEFRYRPPARPLTT